MNRRDFLKAGAGLAIAPFAHGGVHTVLTEGADPSAGWATGGIVSRAEHLAAQEALNGQYFMFMHPLVAQEFREVELRWKWYCAYRAWRKRLRGLAIMPRDCSPRAILEWYGQELRPAVFECEFGRVEGSRVLVGSPP